jgi:hypothetical protein
MNVQIVRFVDIWSKGLCLKICNTVRCHKELVSQDSSSVERRNLTLFQGAKFPKLCGEAEDVEGHIDRYWCKEVDE